MMILDIAQIILGILFLFVLPGFFITQIFFNTRSKEEQVFLTIVFSIMIGLIIGVFFGYDRNQAEFTGGFTTQNIWLGELIITTILAILATIVQIYRTKKKNTTTKDIKRKSQKTTS